MSLKDPITIEKPPEKKRIVVICPGRGSYTAETLGYIKKHPQALAQRDFIEDLDRRRQDINEPTITELDGKEKFSPALHTRGEHASPLIYACSALDFMNIDTDQFEVSAICGNSMGWYLALALGGVLEREGAFELIQTMGSMMKHEIIGGQIIYPIVDDQWQIDHEKESQVQKLLAELHRSAVGQAYISIWLGGYVVIGGDKPGLQFLLKNLPRSGDYPFQLINHAAFHTPLLFETSQKAFELIPQSLFSRPKIPLIDGRGMIWQPYSTDVSDIYNYTLGHQVHSPYDFTSSVTVALKEFAPDQLWLLGPGASLGGAIGQILVKNKWQGIIDKNSFKSHAANVLTTTKIY